MCSSEAGREDHEYRGEATYSRIENSLEGCNHQGEELHYTAGALREEAAAPMEGTATSKVARS